MQHLKRLRNSKKLNRYHTTGNQTIKSSSSLLRSNNNSQHNLPQHHNSPNSKKTLSHIKHHIHTTNQSTTQYPRRQYRYQTARNTPSPTTHTHDRMHTNMYSIILKKSKSKQRQLLQARTTKQCINTRQQSPIHPNANQPTQTMPHSTSPITKINSNQKANHNMQATHRTTTKNMRP